MVSVEVELILPVEKGPRNTYRQDGFESSWCKMGTQRLVTCRVAHEKWAMLDAPWQGS